MSNFDPSSFCTESAGLLVYIGWILTFFKVAIPLVILSLGMFDFGKAVVASEEDEIKKQTSRLITRAVAGILIFFIPQIVLWIFRIAGNYRAAEERAQFKNCETCILEPWNCIIQDSDY